MYLATYRVANNIALLTAVDEITLHVGAFLNGSLIYIVLFTDTSARWWIYLIGWGPLVLYWS